MSAVSHSFPDMSGENTEDSSPNIDNIDFPSSREGLEELRIRFDSEDRRAEAIETKAGTVFALNAVIVSATSLLAGIPRCLLIAILFFSIVSAVQALRVLGTYDYQRPMKNAKNISRYISLEENEFHTKFVELYIKSINNNQEVNEKRIGMFRLSVYLTMISILILTATTILSQPASTAQPSSENSTQFLYTLFVKPLL